ncbi:MAG TPA: thiamine pyrophosphate-binding protein [Thermodesulfobacteriota bacterium]|nr:thiamine pyrophosphate-binding protein [Thermodesulfobacteriota bacterium]
MSKVHGGWLVVKTLHELGVREIFSLSGGHINPIYDACVDFGIRLIDFHHEQGASMAADAYGRVKRQPGICLVTAGPGFTNTLTGIAGAYLSNSPCLLLSGKSGIEENDRLPLQDIDQQAVITPITKWARTIFDPKRIPEYVSTAYKKAISGRPGPVYLGMPYEVLYANLEEGKVERYNTEIPSYKVEAAREAVARAVEMLKSARRPVVIAGSGAWYSGADEELKKFIDRVGVPTFTLNFGRGILSDDHPMCFGAASPSAPVGFKKITSEADLILLLGIRLSLYIGFGRTFNPDAKVIQVDIDPGEIGRNRPADLGIIGDVGKVLFQLSEYLERHSINLDYKPWAELAQKWREEEWQKAEEIRNSNKTPIHALRVIKEVEQVLGGDGMLVIDGGDTQVWTDTTYHVAKPGHYVKGGPLGCMGVGVPFAIGTKVAYPDRQVALISGDGAIGMNFMELETAIRHKIPFVTIVCNDQSWGMTKHQLWLTYGRERQTVGVDLPFTPFHELVKVLGGYGELVTDPKEIRGALLRAFSSGVPALINIPTDPEAISPATYALTQMMLPKEK